MATWPSCKSRPRASSAAPGRKGPQTLQPADGLSAPTSPLLLCGPSNPRPVPDDGRQYPRDVFHDRSRFTLGSFYVNDFQQVRPNLARCRAGKAPGAVPRRTWRRSNGSRWRKRRWKYGAARRRPQRPRGPAGPLLLTRLQHVPPSAAIVGGTAPGVSLRRRHHRNASAWPNKTLGQGMGYEWTEINYIQIDGRQEPVEQPDFSPLAVVFVFLVLAAQYEKLGAAVGRHPRRAPCAFLGSPHRAWPVTQLGLAGPSPSA